MVVNVEVWSDVACPWCLLGNAHLRAAIDKTGVPTHVEMRSYQLAPGLEKARPVRDYLIEKYGSESWVRDAQRRLREMGAKAGLTYDFDRAMAANTFDAHRLHHYARSIGRGPEAMEALLRAQHTEGVDVSSHDALRTIATGAGLDAAAVDELLAGDTFADSVREEVEEARLLGVQGVPFFVFDRRFALSGAQPVEAFERALRQAAGV